MNDNLYFFKHIFEIIILSLMTIAAVLMLTCVIVKNIKSENQDNNQGNKTISSVMELEETNEIVEIKSGITQKVRLWYDKKTKLVYLDVGGGYSNFIPYMKDKNTQYIWNGKTLE